MKTWLQRRAVRHGLFWTAVVGFFLLIQLPAHLIIGTKLDVLILLLNHLPLWVPATYVLLYGILPRLRRRQLAPLGGVLLAGWVLASAVLTNLMQAFYDFVVAPGLLREAPAQPFRWANYLELNYAFFTLLITAGGAFAIKVVNDWSAQRRLQQALLQRKLHAELELLKAQLQPAFLFNTLRTLHALTARKAPESPAAVLHLSALLRYMLYESPLAAVPLADEAAMMRHYVALEQLRLGPGVDVSLNFSGALGTHPIAPLLLLPFVENAFRHGTGKGLECPWVSIDLVAKKNSVTFKVINSRSPAAPDLREGPGLRSVRQRLAHFYPGRHGLKVVVEPDTFLIALHLQLAPPPAAPPAPAGGPRAARQFFTLE